MTLPEALMSFLFLCMASFCGYLHGGLKRCLEENKRLRKLLISKTAELHQANRDLEKHHPWR